LPCSAEWARVGAEWVEGGDEQMSNIYLERSKNMIDLAFKEFHLFQTTGSESYAMQAGEKAWNSLAQLSMYYSKSKVSKHKQTIAGIEGMKGEDHSEMKKIASIADSLHANFYHNFKSEDILRNDLEVIRDFVNKKLKEEGYLLRRR
jgi:hypothetical protein